MCCGPSSALRPGSDAGLPIMNVPAGMGTISKVTFVFGMVSVYFASAAAACRADVAVEADVAATAAIRARGKVKRMIPRFYLLHPRGARGQILAVAVVRTSP